MTNHEHTSVWAQSIDLLSAEFGATGWALWGLASGVAICGDEAHLLDDPAGEQVTGDGVTKAEVLALMIYVIILGAWWLLISGVLATPFVRRLERRMGTLLTHLQDRRPDAEPPEADADDDEEPQ